MPGIKLIIDERVASIGLFNVGRLLPFRSQRMVGPFIYLDHMGPVSLPAGENIDVLPHPHIGLSTLTWLLEGAILHRDSLGHVVEIKPGEVNWMTAGKGIVHSERTPEYLRVQSKRMHGLQIWVALPAAFEKIDPAFIHIGRDEIPHWKDEDLEFKLIAGEAFGRKSPVPVCSELFLLEIKSSKAQKFSISPGLPGEAGMYVLEGSVAYEGNRYGPRQLLIFAGKCTGELRFSAHSIIYLMGGEPFPEERLINWNFVATTRALIESARSKWQKQEFDRIPGEHEFVPLPQQIF